MPLLTRADEGRGRAGRTLADVIEFLVDARTGILGAVEETRPEAGAPNFFHFRARAANTAAFTRQANFAHAAGVSARREVAAAKAVGEAIERYCSAIFDVEQLPLATCRDASFPCTAPHTFALYSQEQYDTAEFPWVPFTEQTPVRWTMGTDLGTGAVCYVPACRVYMPYTYYKDTGDAPIDQPISTGLACHMSSAEAIRSAIGEVVERDAFLITWQAMLAPPQINLESLSAVNLDLVARFERTGSSVVVFDITLDHGIPTILSVLLGNSPGAAAMVVAASAAPDPEDAVRRSLEELALTRLSSQYLKTYAPAITPDPPAYSAVGDQRAHLQFWTDHANFPLARFLFESNRRVDFDEIPSLATGDPATDVRSMVERVQAVGEQVIVCDLTTADVADLGIRVVRAVIPGFHPLHIGHRVRALGGTRLWRVPQRLGFRGITPAGGDNPAPHPYP